MSRKTFILNVFKVDNNLTSFFLVLPSFVKIGNFNATVHDVWVDSEFTIYGWITSQCLTGQYLWEIRLLIKTPVQLVFLRWAEEFLLLFEYFSQRLVAIRHTDALHKWYVALNRTDCLKMKLMWPPVTSSRSGGKKWLKLGTVEG